MCHKCSWLADKHRRSLHSSHLGFVLSHSFSPDAGPNLLCPPVWILDMRRWHLPKTADRPAATALAMQGRSCLEGDTPPAPSSRAVLSPTWAAIKHLAVVTVPQDERQHLCAVGMSHLQWLVPIGSAEAGYWCLSLLVLQSVACSGLVQKHWVAAYFSTCAHI